jgi:tape measure domain-containing protein
MATERLLIEVTESGAKIVKRNIEEIGGAAKTVGKEIDFLKTALTTIAASVATLAAGLGVGKLIQYADTYAVLSQRLKAVSKDAASYAKAEQALFNVAQNTRAGFEETVNLYGRLQQGTQNLGLSSEKLVGITQTLNQIFTISGASSEATKNAIIQLGQGLGAGALRGEEFNSVMEATQGEFSRVIESSGMVQGSLRQMAEAGQLTAEFLAKALEKAGSSVAARFAQIPLTVSQSVTQLENAFMRFIGQANQSVGVTAILANAISFLATNIDTLVNSLVTVAAVVATWSLTVMITSITSATSAVGLFSTALAFLAANPLALVVAAIVGITMALYTFGGQLSFLGSETMTWGAVVRDTFKLVWLAIQAIGQIVVGVIDVFAQWFSSVTGGVGLVTAVLQGLVNIWNATAGAFISGITQIVSWFWEWAKALPIVGEYVQKIGEFFSSVWQGAVNIVQTLAQFLADVLKKFQELFPAVKKIVDLLETFGQVTKQATSNANEFGSGLAKSTQNGSNQAKSALQNFDRASTNLANNSANQWKSASKTMADSVEGAAGQMEESLRRVGVVALDTAAQTERSFSGGGGGGGGGGGSVANTIAGTRGGAATSGQFTVTKLPTFDRWLGNIGGKSGPIASQIYSLLSQQQVFKGQGLAYDNFNRKIGSTVRASDPTQAALQLGTAYDALMKFRDGGSMRVGGSGAVDSTMIAMRATKGERIDVLTPKQAREKDAMAMGGSRVVQLNVNITTPDADSFRKSKTQIFGAFVQDLQRSLQNV